MPISEEQLTRWSHQGPTQSSELTYQSIKNCIDGHSFPNGTGYVVYLQGSYRNYTNIYGKSDVDVVIELTSAIQPMISALNEDEIKIFNEKYHDANYGLTNFKTDVLNALMNY